MRTLTIFTAASLALTALCSAQTHVFPNGLQTAEGDTSVQDFAGGAPWWSIPATGTGSQDFRSQTITDLPSTVNQNLTQVSFRRDGSILPGLTQEQFIVEIEVKMSTSPSTAANASTTFANNIGADETTVIARKRIAFGANFYWETFPEPFFYRLIFDQGVTFPYNAANGSLCLDVTHYYNDMIHTLRRTPLTVELDAVSDGKQGAWVATGGRCAPLSKWSPVTEFRSSVVLDDSTGSPRVRFTGQRQYGEHHSRGYLMASAGLLSAGIPVPRLGGAPASCGLIEVDPSQMLLVQISDSDDYGNIKWPKNASQFVFDLPYNNFYGGFQFYSQELNYDIHTQKFAATNYVINQIPVYPGPGQSYGVRTVHASGPGSLTATQGTLGQLGVGPVTEYQ